jgi:hypothetical protein
MLALLKKYPDVLSLKTKHKIFSTTSFNVKLNKKAKHKIKPILVKINKEKMKWVIKDKKLKVKRLTS